MMELLKYIRFVRDQEGNNYCINCQQKVYAETPFSILESLAPTLLIGLAGGAAANSFGGFFIGATIGMLLYFIYWYYIKPPTCPMCNAKNFR